MARLQEGFRERDASWLERELRKLGRVDLCKMCQEVNVAYHEPGSADIFPLPRLRADLLAHFTGSAAATEPETWSDLGS